MTPEEQEKIASLQQQLATAKETGNQSDECNALTNLGIIHQELTQFQQAIEFYQKSLAISPKTGDSWIEAATQMNLANCYNLLNRRSEAIESFSQAYRLFRTIKNEQYCSQAWTYLNQFSESYLVEKQFGEAIKLYQLQIQILQGFDDKTLIGWVLQNLGKVQYNQADYQSAIASFQQMLEIARNLTDSGMESAAVAWLGCAYWQDGQLELALDCFTLRLTLAKNLNDKNAQRETLGWLISVLQKIGRHNLIADYYTEQLQIVRELGDKANERITLYDLGTLHFNQQQYQQALACFHSALVLAEELEQSINKANAHYMLGENYRNLEQHKEAIEQYHQAVEVYIEQNTGKEWAAKALDYLCILYRNLSDYSKAIEQQEKRVGLLRELGDRNSEREALYSLGCYLHNNIQDYPKAVEYFTTALTLATELEQQGSVAANHYMLGSSYRNLGQINEAIFHYQKAGEIYCELNVKDWAAKALENLGNLYYNQGNYQKAIESHTQMLALAREIADSVKEDFALAWLGCDFRAAGQLEQALNYFKERLNLAESLSNENAKRETLNWLSSVYQKLIEQNPTVDYYTEKLEVIRELGDKASELSTIYNLGTLHFNQQQYQQSVSCFQSALVLAEELQQLIYKANAHYMLGYSYQNIDKIDESIVHYQQAEVFYIEAGNEQWVKNSRVKLNELEEKRNNSSQLTTEDLLKILYADVHVEQGIQKLQSGDYEAALALFDQALGIHSGYYLAWQMRGKTLCILGRYEEAIASYNEVPQSNLEPVDATAWFELGIQKLQSGDYEAALVFFEEVVAIAPEDSDHWVNRGAVLNRLNSYEDALVSYDKALEIQSDNYLAWANRGLTLSCLGRYEEAIDSYNKALELQPDYDFAWKNIGDAQFNLGLYEQAIASYEHLPEVNLEPNYGQAWQALVHQQLLNGDYNAALVSSRRTVELNSGNSDAWTNQGIALIRLTQYEEAITVLDLAIELNPNNHNAWCNRTQALLRLERYQEALESSNRALDLDCNCCTAWNNRGAILVNGFKLYVEALDAFNHTLSINPNDRGALENRKLLLSNLGLSQEISTFSDSSLYYNLNNHQDYKKLATLLRDQDRNKDALDAYNRALDLNPNDHEAWRDRGSLLWDLGDLPDAIASYNKAIELNPIDAETYISFGNSLLSKFYDQEALTCFNEALQISQNLNWQAWVGRGKTLLNLGNFEATIQNYNNGWDWLSPDLPDYKEACGALNYYKGLAYCQEARQQEKSYHYWLQAERSFQNSLEYFTEPNLREWYLRVLQDIVPVCRQLGATKEAQERLYEGIDLLDQLVQNTLSERQKNQLSKEFTRLKQWHTDELAEYRTLFMELLDGVDEGWEQKQILEHLGEQFDNSYFIQWLNSFGRQELECWGTPDFDRGYLMVQLGEIGCGQLGEVARQFGQQIIEKTIQEAEEKIEQAYQEQDEWGYRRNKLDYYIGNLDRWSWDHRIVQACKNEKRQRLDHLEEELISRYIDSVPLSDDYLAWFNCGEELRKLNYEIAAIIAFCRTLRLTKGQLWEAWAGWGWIDLKLHGGNSEASRIADRGLKYLRRNTPFYQDGCGILHEIKGDYYQEGLGVLYEIKGDAKYRYEHIKGPSIGSIPVDINNGGLPDYKFWHGWWEAAYECYRKALDCFTTSRLRERRLGVLQKLVKICRCLGKKDEVQYFEQEGSDLLGRLLQEMPSDEPRISLTRKFAAFDQYRVDSLAESGKVVQALKFAEWRKNLCLCWLSSNQLVNEPPNLNEEAIAFFQHEIEPLLDSETAGIYWHLSPAAISVFILKDKETPRVKVLKNELIYQSFANPKPMSIIFSTPPIVTEEDFIKGTSGVYDNQLVRLEYWVEEWKRNYQDYGSDKSKNKDEISSFAEEEQPTTAAHTWREKMVEELEKLAEILNIEQIVSDYLTNVKKLILIPHRDLHLLPLEYLFRDKGFAISRLPSIQIGLDLEQIQKTPKLPPLSIENPETAITLHFAEIESSILADLYQIPTHNRIIGKDATKKQILQAIRVPADILHFTGHAEHDIDSPAESALILANEGKLTLRDILSLPLPEYYLVCLSACETGLTSNSKLIDEFVGLVSGFLAQKTAYVLSTLWRVDEISTALLVIEFYRHLKAGVHPASALKDAQDWLRTLTYAQLAQEYDRLAHQIKPHSRRWARYLKDKATNIRQNPDKIESLQPPFDHPYYWAGFTITGKVN